MISIKCTKIMEFREYPNDNQLSVAIFKFSVVTTIFDFHFGQP